MRHLRRFAPAGWLAMMVAGMAHAEPPRYRVVDVFDPPPYPGPARADSAAIGNGPWSAATFQQIGGGFAAFRCTKQTCEQVFRFERPGGGEIAADVNRSGAVVGTQEFDRGSRGFVDDPVAGLSSIPSFNDACPWQLLRSVATAINDAGLVVGASQTCDGVMHGVLFENDVVTRIPVPTGIVDVDPADVSDKRVVVGGAKKLDGATEAFRYDGQVMTLLGTLGGTWSHAHAVNNGGRIVGCSYTVANAATQAFLYERGAMVALPPPGDGTACAHDINKDGAVVGTGTVAGQSVGFLYAGGATHDLNDLLRRSDQGEWRVVGAVGINNRGQIAATALKQGATETSAVRLEPILPGSAR
ncbi:MAG TPA: hypothetical protein VFY73_10585 [Ideonella sp.]|uniref:hypothetical protein n=1 Tax=Ideonella sp. TaxID=1929293 RepID=UPI002E379EDF|nr:hypothetical protein [Ideonella sp.]HEX5684465.1 hypothetical protein [Ideonella sp.]